MCIHIHVHIHAKTCAIHAKTCNRYNLYRILYTSIYCAYRTTFFLEQVIHIYMYIYIRVHTHTRTYTRENMRYTYIYTQKHAIHTSTNVAFVEKNM